MKKKHEQSAGKPVYVVDGCRTPFLKARDIGPFSASDLATLAGTQLLKRQPFLPSDLDAVVLGCMMPSPDEANIGRLVALRLGCGESVPAHTVMRNCASGMQALDSAAMAISSGRSHLILAGGTEVMSRAPLLLNMKMMSWLARWSGAKQITQRLSLLGALRPAFFTPVIALLRGLTDPTIGLNMGQTAEELAFKFGITREDMDQFAVSSHQRLQTAYREERMGEVCSLIDAKGKVYTQDTGLRGDATIEKLATLKPYFDKKFGMVTAANSSQVTDGASVLILASEEAVKQYQLPILGQIVDTQWAGLNPTYMGLGPVYAMAPIFERQGLTLDDMDTFEINEAFAAQVLACVRAFEDETFCRDALGLKGAMGKIDMNKLNPDGGAIAIGHPVGASGARIILHALETLKQRKKNRAMVSICIGGGQGGAMYLQRVAEGEHK
ncbi:MAG: acetyl-CoA C-acetyltransferase [Gammaproteobacteria bacterium]|nr:acetyl-CoA C-acetyltransferase [Gammaproteobacteria bacterium]